MTHSTPNAKLESDSDVESASLSPPPSEQAVVFMSGGTYRGIQRQRKNVVEYDDEDDGDEDEDEDGDGQEELEIEIENEDGEQEELEYDSNAGQVPVQYNDVGEKEENSDDYNYDEEDSSALDIDYETESDGPFFDDVGNEITKREMLVAAAQKVACPSPPPEVTPDPSPGITFLAIGADMCKEYMRDICPDAKLLGIGRLDGWMYCVDEAVEGVCCYRNVLPVGRKKGEDEEYDTRESVVYGLLWEVHESTIYTLLNKERREADPKYDMARVNVLRLSCENGFGAAFGKGWGLRRELREEGMEEDALIFTGTPGGIGLGAGYNREINRGIVEGCMRGIPDEWVESDVRKWVQYPSADSPIHLK
ncbi:hypothetical protein DSL72_006682 [Monilinia vaccinii-corymbosi]|uniref:Uncharacterized protein n=1 Tax=Monilinia vaccinii-corymbosi TaxID=61207 RepID=A0A8A3PPG0_9HELO|nr:hypothetical protein DSL72_006682 [Monilinia vaccinii-corymbosi]